MLHAGSRFNWQTLTTYVEQRQRGRLPPLHMQGNTVRRCATCCFPNHLEASTSMLAMPQQIGGSDVHTWVHNIIVAVFLYKLLLQI